MGGLEGGRVGGWVWCDDQIAAVMETPPHPRRPPPPPPRFPPFVMAPLKQHMERLYEATIRPVIAPANCE